MKESTALIIDDNKDAADVLALALRHFGYRAAVAYDGASGLAAFKKETPNFVFLDIGMPDMSGYEVARSIREMEQGRQAAVLIAVTGYGQEHDRSKSREAGFDRHLTKPVDLASIKEVLGGG